MRRQLPAVSAAAPPTAAPTTAVAAPTAATLHLGTRLIYIQRTPAQLAAVKRGDRLLSLFCIRHLHETESARAASVAVGHDADPVYLPVRLEHLTKFVFRRVEVEVPNEDILQANCL